MRLSPSIALLTALAAVGIAPPSAAGAQPAGVLPGAAAGSAWPTDRHKQVDAIFAPFDRTNSPGCAVGITRDGLLDYARGYGMSNLEYDVAITPESIFHVASISKQFAAFSVALLAQEGKLSLEDDVRKYLPELPDYGKKITLWHLIHHTSGLRDQWSLLDLAGWRQDDLITEEDVLWVASKQRALNFEPGTEFLYSNTGYTLLAVIVKRVTGKSLRVFADERIFQPLGMSDTHFHDDHTEIVRRRTSAYRPREGGGWRISVPVFDTYGATSLFTTVGDLLKWEENFIHARIGGRSLVDSLAKPATLADGSATNYATGLSVGAYRGLRFIGHSGSDAGYRSDVILFPEQRLAIVALCNGATTGPGALTRKVADAYLGDRMTAVPAPAPAVKVPDTELAALAGVYWSPGSNLVLRLEFKDGALRRAGAPATLVPLGNGTFRVGESTTEWRFPAPSGAGSGVGATDGAGSAAGASAPRELHITGAPAPMAVYRRITEPVPPVSALAAYVGLYRSDEVDAIYTVRVVDGKLKVRWPRQPEATLDPIGGDRFVEDSLGVVTFTRAAAGAARAGQVDGLTIGTGRVRQLRAERLTGEALPRDGRARAIRMGTTRTR